MKPYYDSGGIKIYHGDCRDADGLIFEVLLSDPPYGISWNPDNRRFTSKADGWWSNPDRSSTSQMPGIKGDDGPFDPASLGIPLDKTPSIWWGANHYADKLPASGGWLVWDKRAGLESMGDKWPMSEAELAWTNVQGRVNTFRMRWSGMIRPPEEKVRHHPNMKPVGLMRWCLAKLPEGVVLDPFMGSGTTLVAAKLEGRKAIGIEIEERYCEIAAKRLAQGVLPFGGPE